MYSVVSTRHTLAGIQSALRVATACLQFSCIQPMYLFFLIFIFVSFASAATSPAALPQTFLDTHFIAATGKSITVNSGGDLQAALDSAQPGDEIVLPAGSQFIGNFILRAKPQSGWVTIRTAQLGALPEGTRVVPQQSALMATVASPNSAPAFATDPGAHNYRLSGLEVTVQPSVSVNYAVLVLGAGSEAFAQLPTDVIVDRSYVHGVPTCDCKRGVQLNGIRQAVVASYISEIHAAGQDSQAINGWAGPGPFKIVNNYLEGAAENVLFGGAIPSIANLIPSDIEVRGNHIAKQLAWMTAGSWSIKNLFELKNAARVLVDSNIFEYNWAQAQAGFAILFQGVTSGGPDGGFVEDVTFTNNIVRHSENGFDLCGGCDQGTSSRTTRIYIANNLFDDINGVTYEGSAGGTGGTGFQILNNTSNLVIDHNTILNATSPSTGSAITLDGNTSPYVTVTNNIIAYLEYGIFGSDYGSGIAGINYYLPGATVAGNLLVGPPAGLNSNIYPARNSFPLDMNAVGFVNYAGGNGGNYQLASFSVYRGGGTDGQDPGANIVVLNSAVQGVATNYPGSAPTNTAPSNPVSANPALPPAIHITSPSSVLFSTSVNPISMAGTASGNAGITQVSWQTNHGSAGLATGTTSWTVNGIVLQSGSNAITVTARDAAGNQASAEILVIYVPAAPPSVSTPAPSPAPAPPSPAAPSPAPPPPADKVPPTIRISSPTSVLISTSASQVSITGIASDNVGVAQVSWQTDRGGAGVATGTASWTANVALQTGLNRITLTARDAAGNQANAEILVVYTPQ